MTKNILLAACLFCFMNSLNAQIFKKKSKENNSDIVNYYDDEKRNGPLMSNGMAYFISDILPTNDTNNIKAVMTDRKYSFNQLLRSPFDDEYSDSKMSLLLLVVIERCNLSTLKFFLDNGANPNLISKYTGHNPHTGQVSGYSYSNYPLELAALKYDTSKMNLLIQYGANISKVETALKKLTFNGGSGNNLAFSNYIVNLYGGRFPSNALLNMIFYNKEKITPSLIADYVSKGADINANDGSTGNFGESLAKSLLLNAIDRNLSIDCIKEIIRQGANVNSGSPRTGLAFGYFPLTQAVCKNNFELVKLLVDNGANLNVVGGCGNNEYTPLAMAQAKGHKKISDYLFSKGAN